MVTARAAIEKAFQQQKTAYRVASKKSGLLEKAGSTQIDEESVVQMLRSSETALQLFNALAQQVKVKAVMQEMTNAMPSVHSVPKDVLDEFMPKIVDALLEEGIRLKLARPDNAIEVIAGGNSGTVVDESAVENKTESFISGQRDYTLNDLYVGTQERQDSLNTTVKRIAGSLDGVKPLAAPLKKYETAKEKMIRKKYKSAEKLTDIVRASFIVASPERADEAVAALKESGLDVLDEGWKTDPVTLYTDRKLLVKWEGGYIGEVRILTSHIMEVKNGEGHELYERSRMIDDRENPEYIDLVERQRDLYGRAIQADGLSGIIETSASGNLAAKADGVSPVAVWTTSLYDTPSNSSQPTSGSVIANMRPNLRGSPDKSITAGRRSQSSQYLTSETSAISVPPGTSNNSLAGCNLFRVNAGGASPTPEPVEISDATFDAMAHSRTAMDAGDALLAEIDGLPHPPPQQQLVQPPQPQPEPPPMLSPKERAEQRLEGFRTQMEGLAQGDFTREDLVEDGIIRMEDWDIDGPLPTDKELEQNAMDLEDTVSSFDDTDGMEDLFC